MLKKSLFVSLSILLIIMLAACNSEKKAGGKDGIKVGVLFSLSGPMAITEKGMADAALLAIDEINAAGGVKGKQLVAVVEDYISDPAQAATKARKLIMQDKVSVIIGGLTSASRQAMLPIVEENNSALMYPGLYEGEEYSKNIIYTGAVPNQQLQSFIPWLTKNVGKKVYLIGNDYVYPVQTNNQVKKLLEQEGGQVVGEQYVPMGTSEFSTVLNEIRQAKPDVIFSTLVAVSTPAFYNQYADYGFKADEMPIVSPTTSETEIAGMSPKSAEGSLATQAYFQTVDTPENKKFVEAFHAKYGKDVPMTSVMESSYYSVYLFAKAAEKVNDPSNAKDLLPAFIGLEFNAPQGTVKIDENNHTWVTPRIAKVNANGDFETLVTAEKSIQPEPWSKLLFPGHAEPWKK